MTNKIDPRRVEYKPLSELTPDPRNPKAHDLQTIDASIGRFGVLDLIVQDERTGYIISGHGRRATLSAMQDRGETPPEGVKVDEDTGEWLVPVVTGWASRTDSEAAAALIALNRTTELGGWVDDALLDLLEELEESGDGLEGVGFGEDDIDNLRALVEELQDDTFLDDSDEGVSKIGSQKEYMELYDQRARRMIVLDFSVDEFREVTARLWKIRKDLGVDNNADAVRMLVEQACPELPEVSSEDVVTDEFISDDESRDPAATL